MESEYFDSPTDHRQDEKTLQAEEEKESKSRSQRTTERRDQIIKSSNTAHQQVSVASQGGDVRTSQR